MDLPDSLNNFDNILPLIDSVWLREELDKLRPDGLSRQGFTDVRNFAQTRKHVSMLTLNEAVRIVFVALYSPNKKPLIKRSVSGPTLSKIDPLDLNSYVDAWIRLGYPHGRELVKEIVQKCPIENIGDLIDTAKKYQVTLKISQIRQSLRIPKRKRIRMTTKITQPQVLKVLRCWVI